MMYNIIMSLAENREMRCVTALNNRPTCRMKDIVKNFMTNYFHPGFDLKTQSYHLLCFSGVVSGVLAILANLLLGGGTVVMEPEVLDQVFARYINRDSRILGRSGMGLYICKKIIDAHGGEIGIESELGKGTAVWFRLPGKYREVRS